jgi:hypothetical protein
MSLFIKATNTYIDVCKSSFIVYGYMRNSITTYAPNSYFYAVKMTVLNFTETKKIIQSINAAISDVTTIEYIDIVVQDTSVTRVNYDQLNNGINILYINARIPERATREITLYFKIKQNLDEQLFTNALQIVSLSTQEETVPIDSEIYTYYIDNINETIIQTIDVQHQLNDSIIVWNSTTTEPVNYLVLVSLTEQTIDKNLLEGNVFSVGNNIGNWLVIYNGELLNTQYHFEPDIQYTVCVISYDQFYNYSTPSYTTTIFVTTPPEPLVFTISDTPVINPDFTCTYTITINQPPEQNAYKILIYKSVDTTPPMLIDGSDYSTIANYELVFSGYVSNMFVTNDVYQFNYTTDAASYTYFGFVCNTSYRWSQVSTQTTQEVAVFVSMTNPVDVTYNGDNYYVTYSVDNQVVVEQIEEV